MVGAVTESVGRKLTRARHYLHLRCEVSYEDLETLLLPLIDEPLVRLVSMMDHAPGQRQFKDVEAYARYYRDSFKLDEETFQTLLERHVRSSKECAAKHRTMVAAACRERNLPMASHDDTTAEHVEESEALGMKIAEFPTTAEAARLSHDKGLAVMMGAPNLVRGHSHSGNVSAMDMAEGGSLDILSSDYMPSEPSHGRSQTLAHRPLALARCGRAGDPKPCPGGGIEPPGGSRRGKYRRRHPGPVRR